MTETFEVPLTDFPNSDLNQSQFQRELMSEFGLTSSQVGTGLNSETGNLTIRFETGLNAGEITQLNNLIASHDADPAVFEGLHFVTITDTQYHLKTDSVLCDTSSNNITIRPPRARRSEGVIFAIKKTAAANTVTIDPRKTDTVGGNTTHTLSALNERLIIKSNGNTDWLIVNGDMSVNQIENKLAASLGTIYHQLLGMSSVRCNGPSWTPTATFIYPGSAGFGDVEKVKIIARMQKSNSVGKIRLYDETNSVIIAETSNVTGTSDNVYDLTIVGSLPLDEAVIEVQGALASGGGSIFVSGGYLST